MMKKHCNPTMIRTGRTRIHSFRSGFTQPFLKRKGQERAGFTLIELLLAVSLFVVVSMSLFLSMRSGLLLYKRSDEGLATTHEILYFLNTLSHELRNTVYYSTVPFEGDENTLSFPSVLVTYDEESDYTDMYKVEYYYKSKKLTKQKQSLVRSKDKKIKQEILFPLLKDVSFYFGFFDEDEETIMWKDEWPDELAGLVPRAVKVNMLVTFLDKDKKKGIDKKIERKIWIPHGTWGSEEEL